MSWFQSSQLLIQLLYRYVEDGVQVVIIGATVGLYTLHPADPQLEPWLQRLVSTVEPVK
jgi:hypothetical protein